MAREAGIKFSPAQFAGVLEAEIDEFSLKAFEALVRADEREACAKFFDLNDTNLFWGSQAARYIREKGENK
jgi:hypothetical protein